MTEANAINAATTGIVGNTGTSFTGTAVTAHNVIVGGSTTSTLTNVAPSATSGVPLISQGASSDPAFGTAVVAGGGTGNTTFTAYSVITAGTTATGAFQNVSGVGTSGQVLTSNGAAALPTWQANPVNSFAVNLQTFTSSGTYTPTSGMVYCIIECVGGGGGGGGSASASAGFYSVGGAGGGGGYARKISTAAAIGVSQTVTVGAAGTAGSAGNNAGGNGGDSSVGTLCIGKGATGGNGNAGNGPSNGGGGGVAGTGDFTLPGQAGCCGNFTAGASATGYTSLGGNSYFGTGTTQVALNGANGTPSAGNLYGGGGGGGASYNAGGTQAGAAGAKGVVIITEYIT
ncbi:MAG TPA: hypothetical protein VNZ86_10385 [Bacteroidia bacterium]|jgi:hypothetical protein|nr:hypothetical protein [Bacteroidia bacterium]